MTVGLKPDVTPHLEAYFPKGVVRKNEIFCFLTHSGDPSATLSGNDSQGRRASSWFHKIHSNKHTFLENRKIGFRRKGHVVLSTPKCFLEPSKPAVGPEMDRRASVRAETVGKRSHDVQAHV